MNENAKEIQCISNIEIKELKKLCLSILEALDNTNADADTNTKSDALPLDPYQSPPRKLKASKRRLPRTTASSTMSKF